MNAQQFLAHHGINENPFGQEDAQADHVFRERCLEATHHPAWDKIYGNPDSPSTAVVFGEKGSGKTAMRMQIVDSLARHNRKVGERRAFIIEYDDFNPFLDSFRERLRGRKRRPERVLGSWRLWDHMDAILTLGVTRLVGVILDNPAAKRNGLYALQPDQVDRLTRLQKRDLLLLTAYYNHSYDEPPLARWRALRRKIRYQNWWTNWDVAVGAVVTAVALFLIWHFTRFQAENLNKWWVWGGLLAIAGGWALFLGRQARLAWLAWQVKRQIHVFDHLANTLRRMLASFPRQEIAGQPAPSKDRSDDRYELLNKFQSILDTLGYTSIIVIVDRVDEPHLVNGSAERIRDLLWPMFDNKFLKHPGVGFKLLLPAEVIYYLNREQKEFYERSRLDKQNLVMSLDWTGESLYDLATIRLRACAGAENESLSVRDLFANDVTREDLIGIFSRLRVPRHLFKFLYRLLVEHCNRHTTENPSWQISRETMQSTLAVFLRDLETFDRGMGAG